MTVSTIVTTMTIFTIITPGLAMKAVGICLVEASAEVETKGPNARSPIKGWGLGFFKKFSRVFGCQ